MSRRHQNWLAEDKFPTSPTADSFEQDSAVANLLDHPNICRIKNFVDDPSQAGIVMEFVEGQVLTR